MEQTETRNAEIRGEQEVTASRSATVSGELPYPYYKDEGPYSQKDSPWTPADSPYTRAGDVYTPYPHQGCD